MCIYKILLENDEYLKVPVLFPGKLLPRIYHKSRFHIHELTLQNTEDFVDDVEHF